MTAISTVSGVLALPELQSVARDHADAVLSKTSLQLVLGSLHLLMHELVKAQDQFKLVLDALKPSARGGGGGRAVAAASAASTASAVDQVQPQPANNHDQEARGQAEQVTINIQTRVHGQTLLLLAKTCWMTHKKHQAFKFFRWFTKWYSAQQAQRVADHDRAQEEDQQHEAGQEQLNIELEQLDMVWWNRIVQIIEA